MIAFFRLAALGIAAGTTGTFTLQAATLVEWTFESPTTPADATNMAVYPNNISPTTGVGIAGGVHASGNTDWSSPAGNGSAESFSSNEWGIGDYYQFQLSTTGFDTIQLTWDQTRSGTGPGTFDLAYSIDGTNFSIFAPADNYSINAVSWASGTPVAGSSFAFDLSSITAINNQATVFFRLIADAAAGGTGGTNRVDNFKVVGSVPVPPAVDRFWDANGGPGVGGSGTWNASNTNWKTLADGTGPAVAITPSDRANFAGSSAGSPFTVSIEASGVTANGGLTFETEGYMISGPGSLTLGAGPIVVNHLTGTTTIAAVIEGNAGLTKTGVGALVLTGANTFTGTVTIAGGSIIFDQDIRFGNPNNPIVLDSGTLAPSATLALAATRNVSGTGTIQILIGQTLTINGNTNLGNIVLVSNDPSHASAGELNLSGSSNSLGAITFNDPVNITAPNGVTLTGNVTMPDVTNAIRITGQATIGGVGGVRKFTVVDTPQDVDFLFDGGVTGASRLHKVGEGTMKLQGNSSASFTGGVRLGTAGITTEPGGRLIIDDLNDLGSGANQQIQFNDGTLQSLTNLTGANALPVGISLGAGQLGPAIFTGSPMEFTGAFQLFKPSGSGFQHRVQLDTNVIFSGPLNGVSGDTALVGLLFTGTGSATFKAATNTIIDPIEIDGPSVSLNGALTDPGASVTVKSGRFGGNAILASNLFVGDTVGADDAVLAPGGEGTIGTISTSFLAFDTDAVLKLEINSSSLTPEADQLTAAAIILGAGIAKLEVSDLGSALLATPLTLTIVNSTSLDPLTGSFEGLPDGSSFLIGANLFQIDYHSGPDANDIALVLVPEPGAVVGLLAGTALFGLRRRRRTDG